MTWRFFVFIFATTLFTAAQTHPTAEASRQTMDLAERYLERYKFIFPGAGADEHFFRSALLRFQQQSGLAVTGMVDDETVLEMQQPRCSDDTKLGQHRRKRFGQNRRADGKDGDAKWDLGPDFSLTLKWFISQYTDKISREDIRKTAKKCFDFWERHAKIPSMPSVRLHFEEATSQDNADINIMWARGNHGDPYAFDGRGGEGNVLAHTFYPNYVVPKLSGDIHLDDAEDWTIGDDYYSTKFANVLVHEIGHSLGLTHSMKRSAIMYPVYNNKAFNDADFDIDDKCAFNWIYIGPSNTCLYVWLLSEILARQVDGEHPTAQHQFSGIENNLITDPDAVDKKTVLIARLRRTSLPRCIEDNGVREHIERLLRTKLDLSAQDADRYGKTSCKFLAGLHNVAEADFQNAIDALLENGESRSDYQRLKRELRTFEEAQVYDITFFREFFKFYTQSV